ncbi:hypothetical protein CHLRE_07g323500v5 [Chlamydomonas reinhardtii]|uniref:Nucleotide exchange factor Fes1 domain-containing protein n=1 Tax=Chlamydomonas reinhardtii TaxID=3055 RepID=A0A2K3DJ71_CHLRE|nr:uncharacterized protein CHLRE_07g323500v5 [Chlamydomonas reinhardtii]PNW80578.1 hypothetical protein CHLRE_07g323500v5 [Chlamydomonas reinhardtii]
MEDLLHWAISHSDPAKLAAAAEEAQRVQVVKDLKEQRRRVKELLDHVRSQPTEADMMREGIDILRRAGASDTELLAALQALQVLVEPIDNANDLHPLGGLSPVVAQLARLAEAPALATAAAHVIGTAASNNPTFQRALLSQHPEVVGTLLQVSAAPDHECSVKGLYALAAMVRNLREARAAFVEAGGFGTLEALLRGEAVSPRVKRKSLSLFMDLVDTQPAAAAAAAEAGAAAGAAGGAGGGGDVEAGAAADGGEGLEGAGGGKQEVIRRLQREADQRQQQQHGDAHEDAHAGYGPQALAAAAISTGLPEAVVALLAQPDPDMQEKALLVLQRLAGDGVARQVLRANGADEALVQLRAQLRADAPGPGDEADPYHDYLTDLAAQVAAAMAAPGPQAPAGSGGGAAATAAGAGAGAAAAAGRSGAAGAAEAGKGGSGIGRGGLKGEVEGVEVQQPVLALGGPSRVGPRLAGAVGGEGERGTAKGGSCSVGDGDAGDSDTGSGQCSASR